MEIVQIPVGGMGNLSYVLYDEENRNAVLIDASWESEKLSSFIKNKKLNLRAVLLTHGHFDHTNAVPEILKTFPGTHVYMRKEDEDLPQERFDFYQPDDGEKVPEMPGVQMLLTPGHTGGSVCWIAENALFTGDTLFTGCCGRIDFPESVPDKMYDTLRRIAGMPGHLKVYPGHSYGGSESTIEHELSTNMYLKAASEMARPDFLRLLL